MPKFTLNLIITILLINCCLSCSTYFPTFQEIQACYKDKVGCENVNKYKNYQPDEIKRILKKDNFAFQFSLGIQGSKADSGNSLWQMIDGGSKNPAVFSAFLSVCIMQDISEDAAYKTFSDFPGYSSINESFKKIAPDNALPYYLDAFFKYEKKDVQGANLALTQALNIQDFSHYSTEIFNYSMETSQFLSYPRYIAVNLAMDNTVIASSPLVFKKLADLVFQHNNLPAEVCSSVFHLGEQLENNSFMLMSKLVGNALKIRTMTYQEKKTDELEKRHSNMIAVYNDFLILSQSFNEDQLYLYLDRVLKTNELDAMKSMINNP